MATKIPSTDQHLPLHDIYGVDDCCLCRAEARAIFAEAELYKAKQEIRAIISDEDSAEFLAWKQDNDERKRKQGRYWLTEEGRAEIRETWPSPYGQAIPPVLLDALEAAEARVKELEHSVDKLYETVMAKPAIPYLDAPYLGEE